MKKPDLRIKTKSEFLKTYEESAKSYDIERSISYEGRRVNNLQIDLIDKILSKAKCKKILEAGCGTGRILYPLAKKGFKCYGIDPSKNMLAQLKQKLKGKNIYINLKKGSIEKIPYKSNTFDGTYTMHVLMHLPKWHEEAIQEMYRVTKKGGVVIYDFPNKNSIWTRLAILLNQKTKRTHLFTVKQLKMMFKNYDYKITGLFSYARTFYKIPALRSIIAFLDNYLPLPVSWRTQLIVIVKK